MAEENNGAERTEEPTPRRRQEDLDKGDPAVSQEASIAMSLLVLLIAVGWLMPSLGRRLVFTFQQAFSRLDLVDSMGARISLTKGLTVETIRGTAVGLAYLVLPVGLLSLTMLVGAHLAQVGPRFQLQRLKVDWSKLDPRNGIKRVFSMQFFVTLAKSMLKGLGIVAITAFVLRDSVYEIWKLPFASVYGLPAQMQAMALTVLAPVTFAVVVLALLDVAWTRYRKEEGLKMSKQEVREDMKSDSGDPHIRQARRQRMKEMVLGQPLPERMKEATVVTTNPTHYAVALRYWPKRDEAPVVVAKGKDFRAEKIRELAKQHGVPVIEDKPLARGLFGLVPEGQAVPRELFQAVARLLAIVYRQREANA